jgi:hypothetical protein
LNTILRFLLEPTEAPRSVLLVRIAVGLIFFTQSILKYIDPGMGVVDPHAAVSVASNAALARFSALRKAVR